MIAVVVVIVISALVVVFGPLDISTSRRALVSEDFSNQRKEQGFFRRFGRPDIIVLLVKGGSLNDRRTAVDQLQLQFEEIPQLKGRVLGRLGPEEVAEIIFLYQPELLKALSEMVERHGKRVLDGDLVAWVRELEQTVQAGLDRDQDVGPPPSQESSNREPMEQLAQFADLIRGIDRVLKNGGNRLPLASFGDADFDTGPHLDAGGYLVDPDEKYHFLLIFPELQSDEGAYLAPLVGRIRQARDRALAETGIENISAELTGEPILAVDELNIITKDSILTSFLSAFGILLFLYFAFRSLRQTIVALVPLLSGIVITLGVVELLYDGLNLVTSSFMSVLMGLGIDFGVHTTYRFGEEQRAGRPASTAMRFALIGVGPGIATGAISTILAFLTIIVTDFTAYAQLGVIASVGMGVMMVCTFLMIPPLMRLGTPRKTIAAPELPGVSKIVSLVGKNPRTVLVGAAIATVASVISFLPKGPGYNSRYYDFLPKDTESYHVLQQIETIEGMGIAFANLEVTSFDQARELTAKLKAAPEVGEVQSVTDLFPPLTEQRLVELKRGVERFDKGKTPRPQKTGKGSTEIKELLGALTDLQDGFDEVAFALRQSGRDPKDAKEVSQALVALKQTVIKLAREDRRAFDSLEQRLAQVLHRALETARRVAKRGQYAPEDLPPLFRHRFVSKDSKRLAVYAYPSSDIWDSKFAQRFSDTIYSIDANASGLAVDIRPYELLIINGFTIASMLSLVLVAFSTFLIFRNPFDAALSMLPVIIGVCWLLGLMKPLGIAFSAANIVALPLLFGTGLDAGAHMVHRYRENRKQGGDAVSLSVLVRGTGAAVIVASFTTMAGFGALMAADYRAMQDMGLLLTMGIGLCLLSSLLVLPALLVVLRRVRSES
jgi:predicted RND superfamily exporter protein